MVLGALASRDWRPMHHDYDFAINRNGTQDIFLNTPNQAPWFERYVTDWTGPTGRLGRMTFRMTGSVFPGTRWPSTPASPTSAPTTPAAAGSSLAIALTVAGEVKTTCTARVALPVDAQDNPWARSGDRWQP